MAGKSSSGWQISHKKSGDSWFMDFGAARREHRLSGRYVRDAYIYMYLQTCPD